MSKLLTALMITAGLVAAPAFAASHAGAAPMKKDEAKPAAAAASGAASGAAMKKDMKKEEPKK
jgi:hypothetical protein